ncbi:MAG: sugar-transfer associated ATP-grasp domain-containing protein [Bacilli bacterium]|nr:sugar-transfer associated ATP-grasp domain-containing protein [Bacilli bacterium]MDD4282595.1 sugar-transfer associated ATP-grasp domain-containing protein [Bacilli bacterium]MDD4718708.1 sugar-transfer associated ATP-grasp domain-containing protein [Bacilli bacterium]
MKKLKYLLYSIKNIDVTKMFKIIKVISVKANKNIFLTFLDVIYCGIKYQAGYHDYLEFEFYNLNSKERLTYITRGINNQIVSNFNDKHEWYKFDDKFYFQQLFNEFTKRDFMLLDNNYEEFKSFLKKHKVVIAKPRCGEGGEGIEKIVYDPKQNIEDVFNQLVNNNQLLIEECVTQHEKMNELYDQSVNTLRMFTFIKDGKSHFLQAVLKLGNGGIIDNFAGGGMYTILDDSGKVIYKAIDKDDNTYETHPVTNKKIIGFQVPMFDEAVRLVIDASAVVPEVGYIGWDVAISKDGPIIIEGNCYPGVFQTKPSLKKDKTGALPKYNKVMNLDKEKNPN